MTSPKKAEAIYTICPYCHHKADINEDVALEVQKILTTLKERVEVLRTDVNRKHPNWDGRIGYNQAADEFKKLADSLLVTDEKV